jgi:hypothetical protein
MSSASVHTHDGVHEDETLLASVGFGLRPSSAQEHVDTQRQSQPADVLSLTSSFRVPDYVRLNVACCRTGGGKPTKCIRHSLLLMTVNCTSKPTATVVCDGMPTLCCKLWARTPIQLGNATEQSHTSQQCGRKIDVPDRPLSQLFRPQVQYATTG